MEKISIARRRLEKKKSAVYVKNKPNDSPSDINYRPSRASYSSSGASCPLPGASSPLQEASPPPPQGSFSPQEAGCSSPEASFSQPRGSFPLPEMGCTSPETGNNPQQRNASGVQSPPVYSLDSLISLINEEGGLLELGKKQFTLEIVSGVEKPIKMLVSIQPADGNSNFPDKNRHYEEGYLTPDEAAQALKVSKNTIYRQLKEGSLKGLKIGCRWRVLLSPQGKIEGSERGNG